MRSSARTKTYEISPDLEILLENQLRGSLRPVQPDPAFVGHLQTRLTTPSLMTVEHRQNTAFGLLLVAFSFLSGVLLVLLLRQFRPA